MHLSDHDLKQIDTDKLAQLPPEQLLQLSSRLLQDLKEARDRLHQTPDNSSKPPSSRAPWEISKPHEEPASSSNDEATDYDRTPSKAQAASTQDATPRSPSNTATGRNAGKQRGSPGYGRTQKIAIDQTESHHPSRCSVCSATLVPDTASTCYGGWDSIDLAPHESGQMLIRLICTRHHLYEARCACGHYNRAHPHHAMPDPLWENTELCEWRLIGPDLTALIVFLGQRMRLSRARIQEWFEQCFGLHLSTGLLDQTLREAGRAAAGLEDALVEALLESELLHVDESPWKERGQPLWFWAFVTAHTAVYFIGYRTSEILNNVLGESFGGQLMSDGYQAYRHHPNRLRCWAHLKRKLQGLTDSCESRVAQAGQVMQEVFSRLMRTVYARRENPDSEASGITDLVRLRQLCEQYQHDPHDKLKGVAREFLNDWEVIVRPVHEPHLPLTNNTAERALRHWVIARRLSQGTRSESGSRALAILASVIDTCRLRGAATWSYIGEVIRAARQGLPLPALPAVPISA
jgi:hypothetical protein